jgi:hypothetical protein
VTEPKGPTEQAVELMVFAPIGFALEAKNLLPTFIERGRQQVLMAKMIGRFAVSQGQVMGRKRLSEAQLQAEAIMAEFGLGPGAAERGDRGARNGSAEPSATAAEAAPAPVARPPVAQSSAASEDLAIAGYDSLAASHVIPRLAGLDAAELEAVRAYESSHRARKTILGKIAQLQGS